MKKSRNNSKTKKVFDILIYVGIFVFFLFALITAILRTKGSSFRIFNTYYDVVLTDSMSVKNEKHADFLEGHEQFKPFDLVKSKVVKAPTDLHVYDVVIYDDPYVGKNMHRIVGIEENSCEKIFYKNGYLSNLDGKNGVSLPEIISSIETTSISFKDMELQIYTTSTDNEDRYYFNASMTSLIPTIAKVSDGSGQIVTYKIHKDSSAPTQLYISHKYSAYDYNKDLILSLKINSATGDINSFSDNLVLEDDVLYGKYNPQYSFEIRGDKYEVSDGKFSFDKIHSKVVKNYHKAGYLFRFLESIWGGIMFVLLGFILLFTEIFKNILLGKESLEEEQNRKITFKEYFAIKKAESKDRREKKKQQKNNVKRKDKNK